MMHKSARFIDPSGNELSKCHVNLMGPCDVGKDWWYKTHLDTVAIGTDTTAFTKVQLSSSSVLTAVLWCQWITAPLPAPDIESYILHILVSTEFNKGQLSFWTGKGLYLTTVLPDSRRNKDLHHHPIGQHVLSYRMVMLLVFMRMNNTCCPIGWWAARV